MSIKAAVGLQGHGKTYETVLYSVVPAIESGRRVVTNIRGLDRSKIVEYIETKRGRGDPASAGGACPAYGEIVTVSADDFIKPKFFPRLDAHGLYDPEQESVVKPGDLVIADEAWRFWSSDNKIPAEHMAFFREHRQFVCGRTNNTCDLVVISQSIGDIHRKLKSVIELTTVCFKKKEIGLDSAYTCEVYTRARLRRNDKISFYIRRYDKAVFPLYKSYSGGVGVENAIDERQNLLNSPAFKLRMYGGMAALLIVIGSGMYLFRSKVSSLNASKPIPQSEVEAQTAKPLIEQVQSQQKSASIDYGSARLVGYLRSADGIVFMIEMPDGRTRFIDADADYRITRHSASIHVDGETLVTWKGGRGNSGFLQGVKE